MGYAYECGHGPLSRSDLFPELVIETPGGAVFSPHGTRLVAYVSKDQVSAVSLQEGQLTATDQSGRTELIAGQAWYSTPLGLPNVIGGIEARRPYSAVEFKPFYDAQQITSDFDKVLQWTEAPHQASPVDSGDARTAEDPEVIE